MTFPVVQSVTPTIFNTNTTAHAVAMPATVNAGDLLIVLFASDGPSTSTIATPAGWTQLMTNNNSNSNWLSAYMKKAAGTEGGTTVDFVTAAVEAAAAQVYRITGWRDSGTLANDVEIGVVAPGAANPDPPSLNPANWDVEDTLWLAFACANEGTVSSYPTNFTDGTSTCTTTGGAVTTGAHCMSARRANAAAAEDPGVFTLNANSTNGANTIGIRPAAAGGGADAVPQAWAQYRTRMNA